MMLVVTLYNDKITERLFYFINIRLLRNIFTLIHVNKMYIFKLKSKIKKLLLSKYVSLHITLYRKIPKDRNHIRRPNSQ